MTLDCPGTSSPGIRVFKTCPTTPVQPGGTLTFSGSVTNTGDVSLNNVTVYNGTTVVFGPATLAVRGRATFNGSYTVPPDSCGPYVDTLVAQATSSCGGIVTDSVTVPCPGTNTPSIRVTKACPTSPVPPGGVLAYPDRDQHRQYHAYERDRGEQHAPPNTVVFGPADLAPGREQCSPELCGTA